MELDDERERCRRTIFKENYGRVDDNNALLHAHSWDIYLNEK